MRILVTGADGMLGSNLVRLLLEVRHLRLTGGSIVFISSVAGIRGLQPRFPLMVERLIIRKMRNFEEGFK